MADQKNLFLAIALSLVILITWNVLVEQPNLERDKAAFEQQIENATPLSNYLFDNLIELHKINLGSNEGKSALRAYASALINQIPDPYFQELLEKRLDERTGFDNSRRQPRKKHNETSPKENSDNIILNILFKHH